MSNWTFLNNNRVTGGPWASMSSDGFNGMFEFSIPGEARRIRCIASDGLGWQHVSVSFGRGSKSTPSWELMCAIKDLFWEDEDWVAQFHPAKSQYVNNHPGCLHLWRSTEALMPVPVAEMVGIKT
jgi:hypothetical protein